MAGTLTDKERKSAYNPKTPGMFPGDYKVTKCRLISPTRGADNPIDLQKDASAWQEINFYEDLYSPIVSGEITIQDGVGLIESVPIVGEEVLEISMATAGAVPSPIGSPAGSEADIDVKDLPNLIINRFRIYKVDPPVKINDNFRSVKLYFVSDAQITNMMVKVQKTYPTAELTSYKKPENPLEDKTYTIADMVRDIFYDAFLGKKKPANHRPTSKNLLVEPTKGVYSACIPNWTPFKAINFLATRALSANPYSKGANFVFYETLKGFRFVAIETLMQGGFRGYKMTQDFPTKFKHYNTYKTESDAGGANTAFIPVYDGGSEPGAEPFTPLIGTAGKKPFVAVYVHRPGNLDTVNEAEKRYSVTEFHVVHTFDTVRNLGLGMYANRVLTHDLVRMKWSKNDFHYVTPEETISFVDATTGAETIRPNPDKPAKEENTSEDDFFKADPGKVCSNAADMLGKPETYTSLYPSNKGIYFKFAKGIRSTAFIDKEGDLSPGGDFEAQTVHGGPPSDNPKETEKRVEEWLGQRTSQKRQLETIKLQFSVPGDSAREVGDLIWFQYPSENPEPMLGNKPVEPHKYYSGKYLITALKHKLTGSEYTIHIEAIKDGYRSQISPNFGLVNPVIQSPDGVGVASGN
tara:strand:- start:2011 stop:3915 length:1905 start_codon:yes stop_codon:yes gene_type:complete